MNLSQLHTKLTTDGIITSSRPYLSQLVREGKLPYEGEGRKKVFNFKKVVKALEGIKVKVDPPANTKKSLHDIPTQKKGQSDKDYKEQLALELGDDPTLAESKIFLTIYQGKIAQQNFEIKEGELVDREEVENKAFIVMRVVRDQMLTLPERLAGELASTVDPKEIKEIMYKEINEILMFLHEGEALYDS